MKTVKLFLSILVFCVLCTPKYSRLASAKTIPYINQEIQTGLPAANNDKASTKQKIEPVQVAPHENLTVTLPGGVEMAFIRIPSGSYEMGSTEEPGSPWNTCEWGSSFCDKPVHTVTIGYDFYFGKYEVTQEQWQAVMDNKPSAHDCPQCPVEQVSWDDSKEFVNALNLLGIGTFRLPSESEWQYAARAGTSTRFFFGDSSCSPQELYGCGSTPTDACPELSMYAWWGDNTLSGFARPVGQKLPNPWGLYDIYGNVYEWCEDDWLYPFNAYGGAPTDGSPWLYDPPPSDHKITLGAWRGYCDPARYRSGFRGSHPRDMRHSSTGLRLVRDVSKPLELDGIPGDSTIYLNWKTTAPIDGTWAISYEGPEGDQESPITDIPGANRSYTLTGLTNYHWYTISLNTVSTTPALSDTIRVMPTNLHVYLPTVIR